MWVDKIMAYKKLRATIGLALKPCPFCGNSAEEELTVTEFSIRCVKCKAQIVGDAENELLICQNWNTRVIRPQLIEPIDDWGW